MRKRHIDFLPKFKPLYAVTAGAIYQYFLVEEKGKKYFRTWKLKTDPEEYIFLPDKNGVALSMQYTPKVEYTMIVSLKKHFFPIEENIEAIVSFSDEARMEFIDGVAIKGFEALALELDPPIFDSKLFDFYFEKKILYFN